MPERCPHTSREFAIVTGLGIGEETKGAAVEWLTKQLSAHTVVRSGGCQGGAHVMLPDGREQMFSQFGAGTFEGAGTHLINMVINTGDLFEEALELEKKGVKNPFSLITIDGKCLVTTPYHSAINRFREIMRGGNKKGTVGKGVGDVIRDSGNPAITIRAEEFFEDRKYLEEKIERIRNFKLEQAREIMSKNPGFLPDPARPELELLYNRMLVGLTAESYKYTADLVDIVDDGYIDKLLARDGAIVGETSHGALLHPWYGFVPHVTQIDPTAQDVIVLLRSKDYDGRLIRLGVSRSYMTRHGAGPLVSYSPELTGSIRETHNNLESDNAWIGEFRNGNYDIVAMRYAVAISGGVSSFDGLSISHMDKLAGKDHWDVCTAYKYEGKEENLEKYFFIENGLITGIRVHLNTRDIEHLNHQIQLTQLLKQCHPELTTLRQQNGKPLEQVFIDFIEANLGLPVVATANGPYARDRAIRPGHEDLFSFT